MLLQCVFVVKSAPAVRKRHRHRHRCEGSLARCLRERECVYNRVDNGKIPLAFRRDRYPFDSDVTSAPYVLTEMHLDSQATSPASHASRQAMVEAWAASVVAAVGATEEVPVVSWALATKARAPATMILVKRILSDVEESTAVIKLRRV